MRYLLLICTDPSVESYDPKEDNVDAWVAEMAGKGIRLSGERLARADRAVTVRKRNGKILRTDGPFAETKERIGGLT